MYQPFMLDELPSLSNQLWMRSLQGYTQVFYLVFFLCVDLTNKKAI